MKYLISIATIILFTFSLASAQKTNDAISKQIKSLKADKTITLSYDTASNATKVMVIGDYFADAEAKNAGIKALYFVMGFYYPGKALVAPPETIALTFSVETKKPKFAGAHNWIAKLGSETLDLGDSRYSPKPSENMEYLNFKIARTDLAKIAAEAKVKFKLGTAEFTFTPAQLTIFKNLLAVSDTP